jgi:hypothetical protein
LQHLFLWERGSPGGEHEHEHSGAEPIWSTASCWRRRRIVWSAETRDDDFGSFALWLGTRTRTRTGRRAVWYDDDDGRGAETDFLFRRRRRRRRRVVWLECGTINNSSTRIGRRRFVWIPASAAAAGRRRWTFRIHDDRDDRDWDWVVWGRSLIGGGGDKVSVVETADDRPWRRWRGIHAASECVVLTAALLFALLFVSVRSRPPPSSPPIPPQLFRSYRCDICRADSSSGGGGGNRRRDQQEYKV